jgi:hypothetical protein
MTRVMLLAAALALSACPPPNGSDGGTPDGGECGTPANENQRLLTAPTTSTVVKKVTSIPEGSFP